MPSFSRPPFFFFFVSFPLLYACLHHRCNAYIYSLVRVRFVLLSSALDSVTHTRAPAVRIRTRGLVRLGDAMRCDALLADKDLISVRLNKSTGTPETASFVVRLVGLDAKVNHFYAYVCMHACVPVCERA